MAVKQWESIKVRYCDRVKTDVSLDVEVIYPAEWLPDQAPRVLGHRCSHAFSCNLDNRASCKWAGTNPAYDPFAEQEKEK
jgi:hypothetical protein